MRPQNPLRAPKERSESRGQEKLRGDHALVVKAGRRSCASGLPAEGRREVETLDTLRDARATMRSPRTPSSVRQPSPITVTLRERTAQQQFIRLRCDGPDGATGHRIADTGDGPALNSYAASKQSGKVSGHRQSEQTRRAHEQPHPGGYAHADPKNILNRRAW